MRISATGSERRFGQGGFTLLEIMLVMAMIAVVAAVVMPRFISGFSASLDDEARRLQQVMQLAADEAEFTGTPIRWIAMPTGYRFERWTDEGNWQAMDKGPFADYRLPSGINIASVSMGDAVLQTTPLPKSSESSGDQTAKPVGGVVLLPGGLLRPADVILQKTDADMPAERKLQVRPGPGGMRLQKAAD